MENTAIQHTFLKSDKNPRFSINPSEKTEKTISVLAAKMLTAIAWLELLCHQSKGW